MLYQMSVQDQLTAGSVTPMVGLAMLSHDLRRQITWN